MSTKNLQYRWYRNWKNAKDKVRAFMASKDFPNAFFWEDVAQKIETGFYDRFGLRLGAFLASV